MRQDYKVFILSLNGLSARSTESKNTVNPIPRIRITILQGLIFVLRLLGYRQASVSEAKDRRYGRFYCPVVDVHDLQSLSDLNQLKSKFNKATVFIAPSFLSNFKIPDAAVQWDRFRAMTKCGWEMGLAGYRYINLTSLRHSAQRSEISRSHRIISERTGSSPKVAAFPAGTFDATTISCCKESGINMGIGFSGLFEIGGTSEHLAPRLSVAKISVKSLASIISFNYKGPERIDSHTDDSHLNELSTGAK